VYALKAKFTQAYGTISLFMLMKEHDYPSTLIWPASDLFLQ